jgi:hypothetical protein
VLLALFSFWSRIIQPWFVMGLLTKACTSAVTLKLLNPLLSPAVTVSVGDEFAVGCVFHFTVLCSHDAVILWAPWMRAGVNGADC